MTRVTGHANHPEAESRTAFGRGEAHAFRCTAFGHATTGAWIDTPRVATERLPTLRALCETIPSRLLAPRSVASGCTRPPHLTVRPSSVSRTNRPSPQRAGASSSDHNASVGVTHRRPRHQRGRVTILGRARPGLGPTTALRRLRRTVHWGGGPWTTVRCSGGTCSVSQTEAVPSRNTTPERVAVSVLTSRSATLAPFRLPTATAVSRSTDR